MRPFTVIACSAFAGVLGGCLSSSFSSPAAVQAESKKEQPIHESLRTRSLEIVDSKGRVWGQFKCNESDLATNVYIVLGNPEMHQSGRLSGLSLACSVPTEPSANADPSISLGRGSGNQEMTLTPDRIIMDRDNIYEKPKQWRKFMLDAFGLEFQRAGIAELAMGTSSNYPHLSVVGPLQGVSLTGGDEEHPAKLSVFRSSSALPIAEFPPEKK